MPSSYFLSKSSGFLPKNTGLSEHCTAFLLLYMVIYKLQRFAIFHNYLKKNTEMHFYSGQVTLIPR